MMFATCRRLLGAAVLVFSAAAAIAAPPSWNGTWVGNWDKGGQGTQIIFAGEEFTGIFWDGDYVSDARGIASKDGKTVTITWPGAKAVLTRDGETAAHIVIQEKGKPDAAFAVKRDNE
jgi:hypothetical protein